MPDSLGDGAQTRKIAEQVAKATIAEYEAEHPRPREAPVPSMIKWLVGAIAAFGSAAIVGLGFWLVSSVSALLVTTARIDERMSSGSIKDNRVEDIERRVTKNEAAIAELKK